VPFPSTLPWIGILLATLANFLLGGLWFTLLFGRVYAAALGRPFDRSARPAPLMIIGPAIWGLVTSAVTAVLMGWLGLSGLAEALAFGLFIGAGYLAATTINTGINPNIPRPLLYGAVSGGYHLMAGVVIALVLALFPA